LDAVVSSLKERFPEKLTNVLLGTYLLPHKLDKLDGDDLRCIIKEFSCDLPDPEALEQEVGTNLLKL
jgi:hypothetical protein